MVTIKESNMDFGPFEDSHCFYVEKSNLYASLGNGIQVAEFALLRDAEKGQAIWLIEAKSSSPQPSTESKFELYIGEIAQKLRNTLQMLIAALLQRHAQEELSEDFRHVSLSKISFKLILVINGHQEAWLPPLQDALSKALLPLVKCMALGPQAVVVLNHVLAEHHNLIAKKS